MHRRTTGVLWMWLLAFAMILSGCGGAALPASSLDHAGSALDAPAFGPEHEPANGPAHRPETAPAQSPATGPFHRPATGFEQDPATSPATDPAQNPATEPAAGSPTGAFPETAGTLQVHFIDVGQGQAQLIIGPTGKTILIDGGDNHMEEAVVAYLREQGVSRIDILIGTHPHADHIGGLNAVVEHFDIGRIYMPRVQLNTKTFESLLLAIRQKGLKIATAKAGLTLDWEEGAVVRMIGPAGEYDNVNNMSAVVHLQFGETAFLFTGDAEAESEADILRSGVDVKADVLLAGHHGSSTSTSEAFLEKADPAYAVIQVGDNDYGHPHKEVLGRLADKGVRIYRTDKHGHIVFTSDGHRLTVQTGTKAEETERAKSADRQPAKKPTAQAPEQTAQAPEQEAKAPGQASEASDQSAQTPEHAAQPAPAGELAVSASIDNDAPPQNSKLTVSVKVTDAEGNPVRGAEVRLLLHYKTTKTEYQETTDASGIAELSFRIGRAAKGHTVKGEITVTAGKAQGRAEVSFTPK